MSAKPMNITLKRLSGAAFEARNESGQSLVIDGPPDVGGVGAGLRPMETLLSALASCSAVDVLLILNQQKQPLTDLEIQVHGERKDAIPAVFTEIHLHFIAGGDIDDGKLARAVRLSMEKYCSVAKMLGAGGVAITHGVSRIVEAEGTARKRRTDDAQVIQSALVSLGEAAAEVAPGSVWLLEERDGKVVSVTAEAT